MLEDSWFHTKDNTILKSLSDLLEEYKKNIDVQSESFLFHINNNKNDYANWVQGVFGDLNLAEEMRKTKDIRAIIVFLEEKLRPVETDKKIEESDSTGFTKRSEEILERMNAMKSKSVMAAKTVTQEIEELEEEYNNIYSDISEVRRNGIDVFIPSLKMKNIKPKIEYLKVSHNTEDYGHIKKLFNSIRKELQDCKDYTPPDLKKEILVETEKAVAGMNVQ